MTEESLQETEPVLLDQWKGIPMRYWAAFLRNDAYYLKQIGELQRGARPEFNWASFLLGFGWMFYRKMLLVPLAYLLLLLAEGTIEETIYYFADVDQTIQKGLSVLIGLTIGLLIGSYGNQLYLWHSERQIKELLGQRPKYLEEAPAGMQQDLYDELARKGGTSWPYVILCFLAAVAAFAMLAVLWDLFTPTDDF